MKLTVDRINGGVAVIITDDGKKFDVPKEIFPDIREGNIYDLSIDKDEMQKRLERIKKTVDEIWE